MSSGPRSLPFSIALRSLQREIIRSDPHWHDGNYPRDSVPLTGMRLARKLGMITYRSAEEWRLRFGRERVSLTDTSGDPFGMLFEVEAYLEHHANKFTGQFDPNCYLYLSRASDLFDVSEHGSSVEAGLSQVQVERAMIIGVTTDFLFPIYQQRELAEGLKHRGASGFPRARLAAGSRLVPRRHGPLPAAARELLRVILQNAGIHACTVVECAC